RSQGRLCHELHRFMGYRHRVRCLVPDSRPTEPYTLSLHDALPISSGKVVADGAEAAAVAQREDGMIHSGMGDDRRYARIEVALRSEEHTSELQSREKLVCRLLLEKKKQIWVTPQTRCGVRMQCMAR